MIDDLGSVNIKQKNGNEHFKNEGEKLDFNLLEFWQWSNSDLISNSARGILAEFLIKKALDITDDVRREWGAYDLDYNGIKIEVKTSAYIQSWKQDQLSKINFGIQPTRAWNYDTNKLEKEVKRQAEIYIFSVLNHKDQNTVDPMNLDQWDFYVLPTKILNDKLPHQKTIGLQGLTKLSPYKSKFENLKNIIDDIKNSL